MKDVKADLLRMAVTSAAAAMAKVATSLSLDPDIASKDVLDFNRMFFEQVKIYYGGYKAALEVTAGGFPDPVVPAGSGSGLPTDLLSQLGKLLPTLIPGAGAASAVGTIVKDLSSLVGGTPPAAAPAPAPTPAHA